MATSPLSNFQVAETKTFIKSKKKLDQKLYRKIVEIVYPQLKENPFYGPNIKKLKDNLEGVYRYRLGRYRLFYLIENEQLIVLILDFKHRQSAYS